MKHKMVLFILMMSIGVLFATESDLPNLNQPRYLVFTSGQPTNAGYHILQQMGMMTVINVLPEKECDPGERVKVIANNMIYFNHPFDPAYINRETVIRFGKLIQYVEKPVLIHCSTGNHVGGIWLAYRVFIEKAPIQIAIAEGRQIGMKPPMEEAVLHWLSNGSI
jgi:protein tyrosine phosphatase (PTP) superfamily phosphohydrolase (DUF442 family)